MPRRKPLRRQVPLSGAGRPWGETPRPDRSSWQLSSSTWNCARDESASKRSRSLLPSHSEATKGCVVVSDSTLLISQLTLNHIGSQRRHLWMTQGQQVSGEGESPSGQGEEPDTALQGPLGVVRGGSILCRSQERWRAGSAQCLVVSGWPPPLSSLLHFYWGNRDWTGERQPLLPLVFKTAAR